MKPIWPIILIALITVSCGKPKPFCGERCLFDKLMTFNQVARIYIDGTDYSEEYYKNDTVFKEILYSETSSTLPKDQKGFTLPFKFRYKTQLNGGVVGRYMKIEVGKEKRIIQENRRSKDGDVLERENVLCGYRSDSVVVCEYMPFKDVFLHRDVGEIFITEIDDDYLTWEYDFNGQHVKVVFTAKSV